MKYIFLDLLERIKYIKWAWENMTDERFGEIVKGVGMLILLAVVYITILWGIVGILLWLF